MGTGVVQSKSDSVREVRELLLAAKQVPLQKIANYPLNSMSQSEFMDLLKSVTVERQDTSRVITNDNGVKYETRRIEKDDLDGVEQAIAEGFEHGASANDHVIYRRKIL